MAKVKPTYEDVAEFADISTKLISKYPDKFEHVDIDRVKCRAINNKDRAEKGKYWELKAIPEFALPDCPYSYYVIIFLKDWVEFSDKIKNRLVCDILWSIPDEEGKVKSFDLRAHAPMVRAMGVDFMEDDNGLDPLIDDINWIE
jgi:hypothetical protein